MIPVDILNYQLIRQLGAGGMGQVFLARNKNINQMVAIKALHPRYANNPALRARFKQEAMVLSSLNHPNIVKFLNYVENEYGVFLIMEYVDGYTLEDYINKKNGLIVEKKAYPMIQQILSAFSYAHKHGIVHRDIKPSNIFINSEGQIKVMDFGIAQILSDVGDGTAGPIMGTPEYMSPEQVLGNVLDLRSDIYSLGVLIHQMLTGRAPYDSTTLSELEIKRRVINDTLPKMKSYYPYISDGMQKVVDKATAKDMADRYNNCDDMMRAVKKALDPDPVNRTYIYIGIAAAVLCLVVGYIAWDYFRVKVEYYKDYAEYKGIPEGIGSLSGREMSHRRGSYRMEYTHWKLRRMTYVNSKDKPIPFSDTEYTNSRYPDVEYFYNDRGQVDYKKVYDQYAKLLFKLDYDENLKTATFKYDDEYGTAKRLQNNTTELYVNRNDGTIPHSNISRYLLDYDEETGLLNSVRYAGGENNDPASDGDNIYGQAYEYDEDGRVITVKFLGQDGSIKGNKIGLAIKKYTYDEDDNWKTVAYYAADGTASQDGNNCALVTLDYDDYGNRTSELYSSLNGTPCTRTDMAVFGFTYEYDDDGNNVKQISVDGKKKPMINKYGWATMTMKYDNNGFKAEQRFYDLDGKPANNTDGGDAIGVMTFENDDKGLVLKTALYDITGNLTDISAGYSQQKLEYDSVGNLTKIAYYDKHGKLAHINGTYSTETREYDDKYRQTKSRFYDDKGKLTSCDDGTYGVDIDYDKQGNIFRYRFIGSDGKSSKRCNNGFAYIVYKYDDAGNNIQRDFCDENGGECVNGAGIHKVDCIFDKKTGFLLEERFSGLSNILYTNIYKYDNNGNVIQYYQVTSSGSLKPGTCVINHEYDKNGRETKTWYTTMSGAKTNSSGKKFAETHYTYDERGNVIEVAFYSSNGGNAADTDGSHKRIRRFDLANRVIYEKNIGTNGKPISGQDGSRETKVEYDERGNQTKLTCYDGYGKPVMCSDGYHSRNMTYDSGNRMTSTEYLDIHGHRANSKSLGCSKFINAYDSHGNRLSEKYYSTTGKLLWQISYKYNSNNSVTQMNVLNATGKLDDSKYGFSKIVFVYQKNGVTPIQRNFYRAGRMVGKQPFLSSKNEWGQISLV